MDQEKSKLLALREDIFSSRMNRRDVLKRATVLGLSAPVIATLLAACGDDDDDPTPTTAPPAADPTPVPDDDDDDDVEPDPTEVPDDDDDDDVEPDPTATPEDDDDDDADPDPTEPTDDDDLDWMETQDRLMGMPMDEGQPGGTIIESSFSDISNTNPIFSADTSSSDFHRMMFEPLIQGHPETIEPVGGLAAAWAVNDDATVWTLRLEENVEWHDGEMLTADDVKFTYDTHMNEDVGSPRTSDFNSKIESVEVVDDHTVQFNLLATLVDFPLDLGVYNIIPEHIWADTDPADMVNDPGTTGQDPSRIIGTGPFLFEEWITGTYRSCVRNDNYWQGAPYLDRYIISQVADQAAGVQQLITGEVDWSTVPEASVPELDGTDVTVYDYPTLTFTFYGTNMDPDVTPLFQEAEVRKALFYALNREELIQSIRFGFGEVAIGSIPVLSWAYNPQGIEHQYPYDPEMAVELLESAGWMPGADGVREKDGVRLSFEMNTNAGNQVREAYLVAFQEYWAQIGVEMQPNFIPFDVLVQQLTSTFDFEVFLVGFSWSATPDQSAVYGCDSYGSGFNAVRYCNPEVDALLEQARTTVDQDERVDILTEYQNVMLDDLPMPVIDFPQGIIGVNQRVHNLFPNAINIRFNSHLWWIED
jgi:peptide/nickel transport system substrate-binding protein